MSFELCERAIMTLGNLSHRANCQSAFISLGKLTLPSLSLHSGMSGVVKDIYPKDQHGEIHQYNTRGAIKIHSRDKYISKLT